MALVGVVGHAVCDILVDLAAIFVAAGHDAGGTVIAAEVVEHPHRIDHAIGAVGAAPVGV